MRDEWKLFSQQQIKIHRRENLFVETATTELFLNNLKMDSLLQSGELPLPNHNLSIFADFALLIYGKLKDKKRGPTETRTPFLKK